MLKYSLLLAILGLNLNPFAKSSEEKELRSLHSSAEAAMIARDFANAKKSYEQILERVDLGEGIKYHVDFLTYADFALRLADAEIQAHDFGLAQRYLTALLARSPPPSYIPLIVLKLGRLLCAQNKPKEAFTLISKHVSLETLKTLPNDDRSFLRALEYLLNDHYASLLQKAKRCALTEQFEMAAALYEEVLSAIEQGQYPEILYSKDTLLVKKVRYRLAESYFGCALYEKTLALQNAQDQDDLWDKELIFLAAKSHSARQEFEAALECYHHYLASAQSSDLAHYQNALLELGLSYYRMSNFAKAAHYLEMACEGSDAKVSTKISTLAAIYLSRIYLLEKCEERAETVLAKITLSEKNSDLAPEVAFLRGMCAAQRGLFALAIPFFEDCLAKQNRPFSPDARLHLALCLTALGHESTNSDALRQSYYEKAHAHLERLPAEERTQLALSRLYLLQKNDFGLDIVSPLKELLQGYEESFSPAGKLEALLILAQATDDRHQRALLFQEATSKQFAHLPLFASAWYLRALSDFNEATMLPNEELLSSSIRSLEKSFSLLQGDEKKASHLLYLQAHVHFSQKDPLLALSKLHTLLTQFSLTEQQKVETLFLKGSLSAYMSTVCEDKHYLPQAIDSFTLIANDYKEKELADDALFALATLHFREKNYAEAQTHFLLLAHRYSTSSLASDALFYAAEGAKLRGNAQEGKRLYTLCCENYPTSSVAPLAYFKCYASEEYFEGKREALTHIQGFLQKFPHSPLRAAAHYFLGLHADNLALAKEELEAARQPMENKEEAERSFLEDVRSLATIKLAQIYGECAEEKNAEELLLPLLSELENHNRSSLYEKTLLTLSELYLCTHRSLECEKVLLQMLDHCSRWGGAEGYFTAKAWTQLTRLAMQEEDFDTALHSLQMAFLAGQAYISADERLELWLLQSQCYERQNKLDMAMKMLSKVINENVVSALRLKAMYERARIYQLEGREELAVRQLEAVAKKGGEWGGKAKESLKNNYGIEMQ